MNYQIVVLAAGKGTRMVQRDLPKVLVPLNGKPLIHYTLEHIRRLDATCRPLVVMGYKQHLVRTALEGYSCEFAEQTEQLGTGHAVKCALPKVSAENVLVLYGDMPFVSEASLRSLLRRHTVANATLTMFTVCVPDFLGVYESLNGYGRIIRDSASRVERNVEYKDATAAERKILEVNPSIYLFNTQWLRANLEKLSNRNASGEFYLTDMVGMAVEQGQAVSTQLMSPLEALGVNTSSQLEVASTHVI